MMTKSKSNLNTKFLECLVCGKTFPKGIVDLKQHACISSLQHFVSNYETLSFKYHCGKCRSYFSCQEHLDMHSTHSTCSKSEDETTFDAEYYTGQFREPVEEEEVDGENLQVDIGADSEENSEDLEDKTMECFVCGKLFPRGPIDLARHANAVTLKHLVSNRRSNEYKYGCTECNRYFTTDEHLQLHIEQSTCNPNMVWPPNASTTAGLRTVHKSTLPPAVANKSATPKSAKIDRKPSTDDGIITSTRERKQSHIDSFFYKSGTTSTSISKKTVPPPSSPRVNKSPTATRGSALKATPSKALPLPTPGSKLRTPAVLESRASARLVDSSGKRKISTLLADVPLKIIKSKKARHIIPQERKAFFAIVSLLITQSGLNVDNIQITNDNYDMFIHEKDRELVNKLQSLLHYTI